MRSVNAEVRQALKTLLGDIGYPVYNNYVPAQENGNAYVLVSSLVSNDASPKDKPQVTSSVRIGIYTRTNIHNSDETCHQIAQGVYQRIYPENTSKIDLSPEMQNWQIDFVDDTDETLQLNSFVAINRFITFRLHIYQY